MEVGLDEWKIGEVKTIIFLKGKKVDAGGGWPLAPLGKKAALCVRKAAEKVP